MNRWLWITLTVLAGLFAVVVTVESLVRSSDTFPPGYGMAMAGAFLVFLDRIDS